MIRESVRALRGTGAGAIRSPLQKEKLGQRGPGVGTAWGGGGGCGDGVMAGKQFQSLWGALLAKSCSLPGQSRVLCSWALVSSAVGGWWEEVAGSVCKALLGPEGGRVSLPQASKEGGWWFPAGLWRVWPGTGVPFCAYGEGLGLVFPRLLLPLSRVLAEGWGLATTVIHGDLEGSGAGCWHQARQCAHGQHVQGAMRTPGVAGKRPLCGQGTFCSLWNF